MFFLHLVYLFIAFPVGGLSALFGLFIFIITGELFTLPYIIIGSLLVGSVVLIDIKWKDSFNKRIESKLKEKIEFNGLFVKTENSFHGTGYLAVTKNYLVFVKGNDVYSFKFDDIISYIVGHKSTNNYVIVNNAILQGGKRVVEIQLRNGDHLCFRFTQNNLWFLTFEKKIANKLGSTLDTYKVV